MEAVPWEFLRGKNLVVEEKIDGSNCGISFDNGQLLLQSRGHYLQGGPREKQFTILKQWANSKQEELYCVAGERYIIYGENMYAKHTVFYDALPHYFMEFDVYDMQEGVFLSTQARRQLLSAINVSSVLVLAERKFDKLDELRALIGRSNFITPARLQNLRMASVLAGVAFEDALTHTDMNENMEGLYVKWEEDGIVKGRYKFVRDSFTNAILEQETHWHDRPIIQNMLVPGAFEKMFE